MATPALLEMPGATLMTRLKVYGTPTPDGQIGGRRMFISFAQRCIWC